MNQQEFRQQKQHQASMAIVRSSLKGNREGSLSVNKADIFGYAEKHLQAVEAVLLAMPGALSPYDYI